MTICWQSIRKTIVFSCIWAASLSIAFRGLSCYSLSDINECSRGLDRCHAVATCTNTIGSYTCTCPSGTAGNGFSCTGNAYVADVAIATLLLITTLMSSQICVMSVVVPLARQLGVAPTTATCRPRTVPTPLAASSVPAGLGWLQTESPALVSQSPL